MRPQATHPSPQADNNRAARRRASRLRSMLLATSALASAALPTAVARAADATWLAAPTDNDFNFVANWNGGVPDGNATFNASTQQSIIFTTSTTVGGMTVTSGAGDYTFNTNSHALTFTGAGLSVQDGASLTLNNSSLTLTTFSGDSSAGASTIVNDGSLVFKDGSKAGSSRITNNDSLSFKDSSRAEDATIVSHGSVFFTVSSNADKAFITSDGIIHFRQQSNGGTARIQLVNGFLDISGLDTAGTTVGSLEGSGGVFLGSRNLAVVGNHESTVFSGVIQDNGNFAGIGGSLTKEGNGVLTLTGINTYTGATTVSGGFLVIDGSIASSSGVTVNVGGTLAGTGTVASTLVNGRLLAGGAGAFNDPTTFGTLTVQGNLTFTAAARYLVQVSPVASASTTVTGTAMLGGATVDAAFAPGSYVTKRYNILHAGDPLSDKFDNRVSHNLSPMFTASLSYDANDVFLNLTAAAPDANAAGLNTNQRNVANAIANSFNLMGGLPDASFATLTPAGLTQISGETAVGTQQATFDAMNQFMGVMLDPTVGALSGGRAFAQANDAYAAMARKAPLAAEPFTARWGVWAAGFGGSQSISGDAVLGSNKTTSNVFGTAAGAEYRFSPSTVAGFALAGGGTHFNVANGGSGNSDLFQAGAYLRHTQGAAFLAAALAYGWQDVTTNRTVTVAGIDNLRARFNANAVSGRLEGGYRVATAAGDLTPYAAGQFISYHLPSYTEQAVSGANTFALGYNGKQVTATRTELGLRSEKAVALDDSTLMLRGRLAWAHDFNTDRNVQAVFVTLPGSAFVVNGAQPAADTALTTVSAETLWRNGWSAALTAEAQLSDTTHSYSGKGVVRYNW